MRQSSGLGKTLFCNILQSSKNLSQSNVCTLPVTLKCLETLTMVRIKQQFQEDTLDKRSDKCKMFIFHFDKLLHIGH